MSNKETSYPVIKEETDMNEIKCPNCGTVFQIDESDYESIVRQVRDSEFNSEITRREKEFLRAKDDAVTIAKKEAEEEILKLKNELNSLNKTKDLELSNSLLNKEKEIEALKAELKNKDTEAKLSLTEALANKEKEIDTLTIDNKSLKEAYESKLKDKDEMIAYYKDLKAKASTKMIGESLEVHCSNEFNRLRPLFKNAYFEKDNEVSMTTGSKGDFIYRDYDDEGTEFISIMFEMKNEADTPATKHKNEDFFKELDKDRKEKNCEYAVLVSMLEADNDLYNEGIVDVSHRYDKMYVIRPQFFIPIITILRNASLNSLSFKKELITMRNQNLDVTHFEENMNNFKEAFSKNYDLASKKFADAIAEIDKSIEHLEKIKKDLLSSENNLRLANNKAQDLSIKKLTKNAPSVKAKFDELNNE